MSIEDRAVDNENLRTCVVLGGRGFIGRHLVLRLLKLRNWIVRIADTDYSLHLDPHEHESLLSEAITHGRASYAQADVRHKSHLVDAFQGSSTVFYMDSSTLLDTDDFYQCYMVIVQGVKNVISACQKCKIKRLIYNSSADVVFDGSRDICDEDESLPYPCKFQDILSDLKFQAEVLVLFANDNDGLLTCALRPSNVFGPGDAQFVPFFLNKVKSGWEKFIVGTGENLSDFTYVENVAHAHICAEEALCSTMASVAGKAFLLTNLEPVKFWDFISLIMVGLGYQRPFIKIPARMIWYILLLVKQLHEKLGLTMHRNPLSDRYLQLSFRTRTFKCSSAQKHLKYSTVVSMEEGVKLTIETFSHLSKDSSFLKFSDRNDQSKVEKLLGNGKVADILLWRNEKQSFTYFIVLFLSFYWFFLGGTFISSAAKLVLLVTVFLYGHDFLPPNMLGFNIQKIPASSFEISEVAIEDFITTVAYLWNSGVYIIRVLAKANDWNVFFKVSLCLYFLKTVLSFYLPLVICTAMAIPFTLFFVYEQYEKEIDRLVEILVRGIGILKEPLMSRLPPLLANMICGPKTWNQNEGPARVKH